jgi:hypothetical protein
MSMVLCIPSSFLLLQVGSADFSQAEKERTTCKPEQIHKMTTIFTQKDNLGLFREFAFCQLCKQFFLSQLNHVTQLATAKN